MGFRKRKPNAHMATKRKPKSAQPQGQKKSTASAKVRRAAKKPADQATTSADSLNEPVKAPTTFLLRLPGDLRMELEKLKDESESKSLNGLVLQLLAEGLGRKADFEKTELFARDLHVATLAQAVGEIPDLVIGGRRIDIDGTQGRSFEVNQTALLSVHQRVVQDLENQKLTSFASIMDPALLAYRLLLEFSLVPERRDNDSVVRDFSNGLKDSAILAMKNRKWALAEQLLNQAVAVDPTNVNVGYETGIYILRRLVRRWRRPQDTITPGVTNGNINWVDYEWQMRNRNLPDTQRISPEDIEEDMTTWAAARNAWELLNDSANLHTFGLRWYERWNDKEMSEKVEIWKRIATIILCTSSPDPDALKLMTDVKPHGKSRCQEARLLDELQTLFRRWASEFRMTREVSRLQEKWADWLEPLEVLWWLGYRKEAFGLATEARGFVADKATMERMALIRGWNPEHESSEPYGFDEITGEADFIYQVIYKRDEFGDHGYTDEPLALFNRPMSV